jgi:hypothetical protein
VTAAARRARPNGRDFGLDRIAADGGYAQQVCLCGRAGARVDQMVLLDAAAAPAAAVAARGGEAAASQLECERAVRGLDADGPAAAARRHVAPGVDEARSCPGQQVGGALRGVALRDAAEVDADAGVEVDDGAVDADAAAGRPRRRRRDRGFALDQREGAVVAGGDERVVDGGVEAAAGAVAGGERQPGHAPEVGTRRERAELGQPRQLGVGPEAGEQRLEPVELRLGGVESRVGVGARRVDEQLHLGAHGGERPADDHDDLVIVSGGSVTTRTDGAWAGACRAAAICERRTFSSAR